MQFPCILVIFDWPSQREVELLKYSGLGERFSDVSLLMSRTQLPVICELTRKMQLPTPRSPPRNPIQR